MDRSIDALKISINHNSSDVLQYSAALLRCMMGNYIGNDAMLMVVCPLA